MSKGTICIPRKPLRCWQYKKDSDEPIPRWVVPFLSFDDEDAPKFIYPDNGGEADISDGDWVVEFNGALLFADSAFAEEFYIQAQVQA